ncbi:MAG: hypothetical protein U1F76_29545 [Candidatus Competibacteraceae bacterium]
MTTVTVVQALLGNSVFALSNSMAQQRPDYAVAALCRTHGFSFIIQGVIP